MNRFFLLDYLFFLYPEKTFISMYIPIKAIILEIKIIYIVRILTLLTKKYKLQSTLSLIPLIASCGNPSSIIFDKLPSKKQFFIRLVPYVPGRKPKKFCNPLLKLDIGIYAPQIKPYPALTIVPAAED